MYTNEDRERERGLNSYQYHVEVYLRRMVRLLCQESGTAVLVFTEVFAVGLGLL